MADAAIHAPADEAELAGLITEAAGQGAPVWVCGHQSKAGLLRPVQAASTISTRDLTGITLYSPSELIISARAGTPLADIEAALAEHGQHLIAEPPDFSALFETRSAQTIGGVVATNLSGPRRIAWGATRDHVMGVRAVNGTGELIRSGGRVLKNVTGLDICKLLTGSHGTLAVMTEITLKVLPAPERTATLAIAGLDPAQGVAALAAALGSPYAVCAAAYLPDAEGFEGSVTLARIEDFAPSVAYRAEKLRADLASFGRGEILDDGGSKAIWASVRDAKVLQAQPDHAVWRISVRPSAGPRVVASLNGIGARWFLDWGGGLVWIAAPATAENHAEISRAAVRAQGTWTLFRAPETLRAACEVIPPEPAPLARISQRVKAAFDPHGILNPGRMRAGS
jgi:glycolate oxidase FAD binding subunit